MLRRGPFPGGHNPRGMRIGIDLGGTKIEAIALGARRPRARAPARRHAAPRLRRPRSQAIAALVGALERETGADGHGRRRHAGHAFARDRPRQERQLDLAQRPALRPRPRGRARARRALRQRRQLLRALGGDRRRGQGRRRRVRRDRRHRHRRRHRGGRPRADGPERDRRRVGAQPAALADGRRAARPGLLLRQDAAASRRSSPAPVSRATTARRPAPSSRQPRSPARRRGRRAPPRRRSRATRTAWRARSPRCSTCSIPT